MRRASRLETFLASPAVRGRVLLLGWVIALGGLLFRAGEVQLGQHAAWQAEAERQHRAQGTVPAPRGAILDRSGVPLAMSHEVFRVAVAPHELEDREVAAERIAEALGIGEAEARRATTSSRRWVVLPRTHPPRVREALSGLRGVHVERELSRFYPHAGLARGVLGVIIDEAGTGGVEQAFDAHLRGMPGTRVISRDSGGQPIPGESWVVQAPRAGGDVVLTLDRDLQEIAGEALENAIEETGARGGDLLVTDPRTGEILAMVSMRDGASHHLGSINTPYEPGSTLKPFTVAGLLQRGRAALSDSVDTGEGRWEVAGRVITDVSRVGKVTLAHALQVSSNVGIAKVAQAYAPDEQYETLRDFGFGMPTGVPLPGEASGLLRHPRNWSGQSAASLAIGYEVSVTPLQMAMAYGALANGGLLMEPRLVREVRAPDGRIVESVRPRVVRRVIRPRVAESLTRSLVDAVEEGTGTRARLSSFSVAGKSGTSRATGPDGRYEAGAYFASFVGFFPAEAPQLVVLVKLERPRNGYYGGATAAPVTRATMEAILAARRPPLDREALASIARSQEQELAAASPLAATDDAATYDAAASVPAPAVAAPAPARTVGGVPALFAAWEAHSGQVTAAARGAALPSALAGELRVPNVRGLSARSAIRALHRLGLQVSWEGMGSPDGTVPGPGSLVQPGDTIRITGGRGGAPVGRGRQ
jgi:cell division protein FtsI (penicillin-binding protein 3)